MNRIIPILLTSACAFAVVLGMGGSSCYAPAIEDCQYACAPPGPGARCPDGLVCNTEQRCASGSQVRCSAPNDDASIDQSMPGDIIPDSKPLDGSGSGSGSDSGMVMDAIGEAGG